MPFFRCVRLDPWHGGGFLRQEDAVPGGAVFVMEKAAHHNVRITHRMHSEEL